MISNNTVVVLDEHHDIRGIIVGLLRAGGFDATPADSIEDAIKCVRQARPHIVTILISSTFNDSVLIGIDELLQEQPRPIVIPTCTRPGLTCPVYRDLPCGEYLGCLQKPSDFVVTELVARIQAARERRTNRGRDGNP